MTTADYLSGAAFGLTLDFAVQACKSVDPAARFRGVDAGWPEFEFGVSEGGRRRPVAFGTPLHAIAFALTAYAERVLSGGIAIADVPAVLRPLVADGIFRSG